MEQQSTTIWNEGLVNKLILGLAVLIFVVFAYTHVQGTRHNSPVLPETSSADQVAPAIFNQSPIKRNPSVVGSPTAGVVNGRYRGTGIK